MKTQSKKAKGRWLQNWVKDKIYEHHPQLRKGDIESRSMGANGEDLLISPAARDILPLSFECKNLSRSAIYSPLEQAKDNCPDGAEPVVILKANRKRPVAVVDAEYFLELFK